MWHRFKIPLTIFAIAFGIRAIAYGLRMFALPGWPGWLTGPNLWADSTFYSHDLALIIQGQIPYRDFPYNYGPLYLYSMIPLYLASPTLAFAPTVLADAGTAVVIFLIVKRSGSPRLAILSGLAYGLFPFAVLNEGYLWMSSEPMTFFILLSLLFTERRRPVLALTNLAFAVLFKQEALFVAVPLLIANGYVNWQKTAKGVAVAVTMIFGAYAPFFVAAPLNVFYSFMYGNFINLGTGVGYVTQPVVQSQPSSLCHLTTVQGVFSGTICGTIVNPQEFAAFIANSRISAFEATLEPLLLVTFSIALLAVLKSPKLLEYSSIFVFLGSSLVFATLIHGLWAYYFLPVYAVLLCGVKESLSLVVVLASLLIVSIATEGQLQFYIPMLTVFTLVVIESSHVSKANPGVG